MSNINICPLLAVGNPVHMSKCREDGCAWWDRLGGACWIASGADCIREAANQLNALNIIIEAQGQEESPASAANAGEGEGGTDLTGPNSTSNDNTERRK
ncbi:MAG: hypothetical protein HDT43_11250 [Ruminococcaceae bacterium]|nr:hypothetical protein [Oscillospiraceae bacterium]